MKPTIEYFKSTHYLKRNIFWEKIAGIWFSFTAFIFLLPIVASIYILNVIAFVVNLFAFSFFAFLAHNCFKKELEYKYKIATRGEKQDDIYRP